MTALPEAETALAVCDFSTSLSVGPLTPHRPCFRWQNAGGVRTQANPAPELEPFGAERADTSGHGLLIPTHEAPGARVSLLR